MLFKREVLITYDFKRMNEVRDILGSKGIRTVVRVKNNNTAGGCRRVGGSNLQYEYKVYVGFRDYKDAMYLLGR